MTDCGCSPGKVESAAQRRALLIALLLNGLMFVIETVAGVLAESTGLIADGLDMLSDASVYVVALVAAARGERFKANAATFSGIMLLCLGFGVVADVVRRFFSGEAPDGMAMIAVSLLALAVNASVLRLLARHREGGVHLRATWIFTRADVVANLAVILAGIAVLASGIRYFDLAVGLGIGLYVVREAREILAEARAARLAAV